MSSNIGISLAGIVDLLTQYNIVIRKVGNIIEWKFEAENDEFWRELMDITYLNSKTVEMQRGETHLQWRIVGDDEWIDLISYDDIAYRGTQPIRDDMNYKLEKYGRHIYDIETDSKYIEYMRGIPLVYRDGNYTETTYLPMSPILAKSTFIVNSNELLLWPIEVKNPTSIVDLGIHVVTAADAALDIVIYNSDFGSERPTTKIFQLSDNESLLDCSITGLKSLSIPIFIEAGNYFIGYQKVGEGNPAIRSIPQTAYNSINGFSDMSVAGGTSLVDRFCSCYAFENIVEDLTEIAFNISSTDRILFARLRANSTCELKLVDSYASNYSGGTVLRTIYNPYDEYYYILGDNFIKKSLDLVDFIDLTYETENYTQAFQDIIVVSNGRLIIKTRDQLWVKANNSDHVVLKSLIYKPQYWESVETQIIGHSSSSNFFITYNLLSSRVLPYSIDEDNIIHFSNILSSSFGGSGTFTGTKINNNWILINSRGNDVSIYSMEDPFINPHSVFYKTLSTSLSSPHMRAFSVTRNTNRFSLFFFGSYSHNYLYYTESLDGGLSFSPAVNVRSFVDHDATYYAVNFDLADGTKLAMYNQYVSTSGFYFNNSALTDDSLDITPPDSVGGIKYLGFDKMDDNQFLLWNQTQIYIYEIIQKS